MGGESIFLIADEKKMAIKLKQEIGTLKKEIEKKRIEASTDEDSKISEIKKLKLKQATKKTPRKTPTKIPTKSPIRMKK